jgi:hypothetical protein
VIALQIVKAVVTALLIVCFCAATVCSWAAAQLVVAQKILAIRIAERRA